MSKELYEKIGHINWLIQKQRLREHAEYGPMADTTRGQGRILAVLKLRDGISTKDLSYLLGLRVSSLNELLAKMEKNGYITREPSEEDKRVMLCKLTEKGRSERQSDAQGADDLFACLKDEDRETLDGLLDQVIDASQDDGDEYDEAVSNKIENLREFFDGMPEAALAARLRWRGGPGPRGPEHGPMHGGPGPHEPRFGPGPGGPEHRPMHGGPRHRGPGAGRRPDGPDRSPDGPECDRYDSDDYGLEWRGPSDRPRY